MKGSVFMKGYTVTNSIDTINAYCNDPEKFEKWQLRIAIEDAKVHYEHGDASETWYNYVVSRLSDYI